MIARKNKLSRTEIEQIKEMGRRINRPLYTLWWAEADDDKLKLSIIVPAKYVSLATKRNSLKRSLYDRIKKIRFFTHKKTLFLIRGSNYEKIIEDLDQWVMIKK